MRMLPRLDLWPPVHPLTVAARLPISINSVRRASAARIGPDSFPDFFRPRSQRESAVLSSSFPRKSRTTSFRVRPPFLTADRGKMCGCLSLTSSYQVAVAEAGAGVLHLDGSTPRLAVRHVRR